MMNIDMNLLQTTLKSQTVPSAILLFICWIGWPIVIGILMVFQGNDRLQFNCDPKLNEFKRQLCYDKYNSAISPLLTPLGFAGITFGLSVFGWLTVTLLNVWLLRRIRDGENDKIKEKKKLDDFYWVSIYHICYQVAILVVMMVLFCCYQKLEYPVEYRCVLANTMLTASNQVAVDSRCNDLRYNEKSIVNIVIIVVFSLSKVLSLVALIHLKLVKPKILEHLVGYRDKGPEKNPSGNVECRRPKRIRTVFTPTQLIDLENAFDKNHYIAETECKQLASLLNLSEKQIKVWFQNRRTKWKRQQAGWIKYE